MSLFSRRAFLGRLAALTGGLALQSRLSAQTFSLPATGRVRGMVFHDRDNSGVRGDNPGVAGVLVSNGREVVRTDAQGRYELPIDRDCVLFCSKPSGWMTPVNAHQLPQFYRIHQPKGSPRQRFPGVAPTGPLPEVIDFALRPQAESDKFRVVLFGDPQPRNEQEIDFMRRDVLADVARELQNRPAAFGISLGDETFDQLALLDPLNASISSLNLPWYNLVGNHDLNQDSPDDHYSSETFKSIYGPTYYSFDYGQVHFVVLDNVVWLGWPNYTGGFGPRQLAWLGNDLSFVPRDKLVVLLMHIPLTAGKLNPTSKRFSTPDQIALLSMLRDRPHTFSISGHTHVQWHAYLNRDAGWEGAGQHHHLNHGTVCGSWWRGVPDKEGIPHATMADGTPNGYSFVEFDGNRYSVRFKAARHPATQQMAVYAPTQIEAARTGEEKVTVNVFAGSPRSKVEMRAGETGAWLPMQQVRREDPSYVALKQAELALDAKGINPPGRPMSAPVPCNHLWEAALPTLPAGQHTLHVRTTDTWGQSFEEKHALQVI